MEVNKYLRDCPYSKVDVYRVLEIFQVTSPAIQHAVKKLLCTGIRGGKDFDQDLEEAIQALTRLQGMRKEDVDRAIFERQQPPSARSDPSPAQIAELQYRTTALINTK
jgi:hypothetical protein